MPPIRRYLRSPLQKYLLNRIQVGAPFEAPINWYGSKATRIKGDSFVCPWYTMGWFPVDDVNKKARARRLIIIGQTIHAVVA